MMTYYILVTMDAQQGDHLASAPHIAETLLEAGFWAFSTAAPVKERLLPGDQLLVYLGGRGRHWFVASCEIASPLTKASHEQETILSSLGLDFMKDTISLSKASWFTEPMSIIALLPELSFVKDKKNYGLSLRLPVRQIPEDDFRKIVAGSRRR